MKSMDDLKPKRKTHTSTEVKSRYNKKVYTQIGTLVDKELAAEYKKKCKERGIPIRQHLIQCIEDFLKNS